MILYPQQQPPLLSHRVSSVAHSTHTSAPSVHTHSEHASFLRIAADITSPPPKPKSETKARLKNWYLGAPGTLLGAALGLLLGYVVTTDPIYETLRDWDFRYGKTAEKCLLQLGFLYLRAVSCVMFPLTITNLTLVSAEITTSKRLSRVGGRVVVCSFFTSALVVSLGVFVAVSLADFFEGRKFSFRLAPFAFGCPSGNATYVQVNKKTHALFCAPTKEKSLQKLGFLLNDTDKLWELAPTVNQFVDFGSVAREVLNVVFRVAPTNFSKASNANLVQLVLYALAFGVAVGLSNRDAKTNTPMLVLRELVAIFETMTSWVVLFTPLALIPLVAGPIYAGTHNAFGGMSKDFPQGNDIVHVLYYTAAYVGVAAFHALVVLPILLVVSTCSNPFRLLWRMKEALAYAFGTSSSRKSLPVLRSSYDRAMGRSTQSKSCFVLQVGASLNMSGGALYIAMSLVWLFYNAGLKDFFTPTKMVLAGVISTIGSYAVAPVRNGGIAAVIVAYAMLTGLPTPYAFNFLLLAECIVDPISTLLNAWSNVVVTRIVERTFN
ncbi:Aste57867_14051 [Aphanomyces stellatus]|uniref:Amino acid transporter n=1 Tax=Aphanomyces stellatus TaxID=120398 RepID=A0A485L1Y4_9STRA|nr:hypothetical protein As57867_014000 [Aphanomyces stellatus]VFT90880.1 Aste57867_14051 [Aphanomyces stellatus]